MSNIFARSPYIIEIDETGQTASKVELYLWNGTGSAPASPQYTLTKSIPASNNLQTLYDIAPYIREYITHLSYTNNYNSNTASTPTSEWCNVRVKRYKVVVGVATLLDTTDYYGFDGYTLYEDGSNHDLGNYHLDTGTYYYPYDADVDLTQPSGVLYNGGVITTYLLSNYDVRYTELNTGNTYINTITTNGWKNIYRIYPLYYDNGNLVEIRDASDVVLWSFTMKPKCVPKYVPVTCDFVNRYGAWERLWFFASSNESINVSNSEYNLMQSTLPNYDVKEGQKQVFNINGSKSIKVNTDWVNESYKNTIQDLMLSQRILIDNKPAKINTKSTELFKSINTKMINYQLEFEFTYNIINSVL